VVAGGDDAVDRLGALCADARARRWPSVVRDDSVPVLNIPVDAGTSTGPGLVGSGFAVISVTTGRLLRPVGVVMRKRRVCV
jgi:hypothetical protein